MASTMMKYSTVSSKSNITQKLCKKIHVKEALKKQGFKNLQKNPKPHPNAYSSWLQICIDTKSEYYGMLVHSYMLQNGVNQKPLHNKLVLMYTRLEKLQDAKKVFDKMPEKNIIAWNTLVGSYAKQKDYSESLRLWFHMLSDNAVKSDEFTYSTVINSCANLGHFELGRGIQGTLIKLGYNFDIFVGNGLIDFYVKNCTMHNAVTIFDGMPRKDTVSWSSLIAGYAQCDAYVECLKVFRKMLDSRVLPCCYVIPSVLSACANIGDVNMGKAIHVHVIKKTELIDTAVKNALIDMYGKCHCVEDSRRVFEKMTQRNIISWTSLLCCYAHNGLVDEALDVFVKMPEQNVVSFTSLISGYVQVGAMSKALRIFEEMPSPNLVSWTLMISGFAKNGMLEEAVGFFRKMLVRNVMPNQEAYASVLAALAELGKFFEGKQVHGDVIKKGFYSDVSVGNSFVNFYAKCESFKDAKKMFFDMPMRDVVSCNTMLVAYVEQGCFREAMELFEEMPEKNLVTYNAMIAGYARMGSVDKAHELFQEISEKDAISWTALISGYAQNGCFLEALCVYQQMCNHSISHTAEAFSIAISACANLASLSRGKELHQLAIRLDYASSIFVANALVDMYSKCGCIKEAKIVFDQIPNKDVVSWNTMISGLAMHGQGRDALRLFRKLLCSATKPDQITFLVALSACCHAGLVDDGFHFFESMTKDYHILPTADHYCCMVDLLGRAGHLKDAENLIRSMPMDPNPMIWGSLLSFCLSHNNISVAKHAAKCLQETDGKSDGHYVLLSNFYATVGNWEAVTEVRRLMSRESLEKIPGTSWIEVNNVNYAFYAG